MHWQFIEFRMEPLPLTLVCLLLSASVQVLTLSPCVSRAGSQNIDTQCQKYCALGQCPNFCVCVANNASDTCAKLDFLSNKKLTINETVKPGTPIFTIQVTGQEQWSYTLGRGGPVDGSVWSSLSKYLKLTKIGNQYEMIVETTPDLENIFHRYGIKLTSLKLILTCEGNSLPNQVSEILLQILPINEHAPEFFVIPLKTEVAENTPVSSVVYVLSDHAIDADVNTATNEALTFGLWDYVPDVLRDGRAYFQMTDTLKGVIQVKVKLDFEALQPMDVTRFFLNASASDAGSMTSYTTLIVDVKDVDDLPPEFYHPSCLSKVTTSKPCIAAYEARIPLHFQGQVTSIMPGLIQARDKDSLNDPVKLSLKQGPGEKPDIVRKFAINETTGTIFVLSSFLTKREIQLVIVARESNKNDKSAEASLLIKVEDTDPVEYGKLGDSNSQVPVTYTSSNSDVAKDVFLISTIVLSLCVLLLMLVSFVLWAKLRKRRLCSVQPAAVSKVRPKVFHHKKGDNFGHKTPSVYPASSATFNSVKEEKLDAEFRTVGLSNDRNQQNVACNQPSVTCSVAPLNHKSRVKKKLKTSTSATSPYEAQKRIFFTVSDQPDSVNDPFGKLAFSNLPSTRIGRFCGQNVLGISEHPYLRNATHLSSNVLILSDPPRIANNHQKKGSASGYRDIISRTQSQLEHQLSFTETESTSSDQTHIFNVHNSGRDVSNANIVNNRTSFRGNITKISRSDLNTKFESSRNKQTSQCDQRMEHLLNTSDDCNDKESDDGYKNDNSLSDESTVSFSGSKPLTKTSPNRNVLSVLPTGRSSNASEGGNEQKQYSETTIPNPTFKTPLLNTKTSTVTEDREQLEVLLKVNHQFEHEGETKNNSTPNKRSSDVSLHSQQNITQSQFPTTSLPIQNSKCKQSDDVYNKPVSISSSRWPENLPPIETRPAISHQTRTRDTRTASDQNVLRRHLARSLSSNTKSKRHWKDEMLTEQNSGTAVDTSGLFSSTPQSVTQRRPHTSDEVKHTNKACSSDFLSRPFTSAPSRLKRKVKRRSKTENVNIHNADYVKGHIQERPTIILQRECVDSQDYSPLEGHQQQQLAHLYPWSIRNILIPEHDPHDHLEVHNHGQQLGNVHFQYPGYEQVYISRHARQHMYSLPPRQQQLHLDYLNQQQLQHNHVIQSHQRSYSVPRVKGHRYHHHAHEKRQGERSKPVPIQKRETSPFDVEPQKLSEENKEDTE